MKIAKNLTSGPHAKNRLTTRLIWNMITSYSEVCAWATTNDFVFSNFKQHPCYKAILEHVSQEDGAKYISEITKAGIIDLVSDKDKLVVNDALGNPDKFEYDTCGKFSPTTLRYTKVASDILSTFPQLRQQEKINIVEIGVGYGGQCLLLDNFLNIEKYTLVDITPALSLAKKYLEQFIMRARLKFSTLNELAASPYDLVISNYAYSELNRELQDAYLNKIILHSRCGYMTYNNITHSSYRTYSAQEFASLLPVPATSRPETPLTHPDNAIITWGE